MKGVITTLKQSANEFRDLISTYKDMDFGHIIGNLTETVKELPRKVFDLRRLGRVLFRAQGKFDKLPPAFAEVNVFISEVTTLFNDVKTDVMNLYMVRLV